MRRTEQAQGLRLMKFEEIHGRTVRGELSQAEAAEVLGMSERTFRRWRDRFEADGAEGLYDRRLGRASARRAPVDEVARVLALFDTRYWDFTAKHFHEKLVAEHGCARSYNWVRLTLQAHGRKRPRRALPGMMVHQSLPPRRRGTARGMNGCRPLVGPDRHHGRRHERDLLGLLRRGREHDVELQGARRGDPRARAVLLALCRSGQPLLAEERTVSNDNVVRYKRRLLQFPADRHRRHYVKAQVQVHEYPGGTLAVFHGPRCLARYRANGEPIDTPSRQAA